ncbi:MAG: [protein-PII] uridylyltransferase family protein [bacterium]
MLTSSIIKSKISSEFKSLKQDLLNFSSFNIAAKISAVIDSIIIDVFNENIFSDDVCIIAAGSYSINELCPFSDIDLMILIGNDVNETDQEILTKKLKIFFYLFWDAAVDLSQSVRTVGEAIDLMENDLNTYTSFINARYITGNVKLYDDFKLKFKNIKAKNIFLTEIMKSIRKKRLINVMVDNDIFLLEPDVKDGIGGLRDYSWCEWIYYISGKPLKSLEFLHYHNIYGGMVGNEDLYENSNLNLNDIKYFIKSKDFILKTRIMMHLLTGKKIDRLTFDIQEKVASAFFYKDIKFLNKIELFMHDYYLNSKNLHINSKIILNELIKKPLYLNSRLEINNKNIKSQNKNIRKKINSEFIPTAAANTNTDNILIENGYIYIKNKEKFLSDLENSFLLLEIFLNTGQRLDMESVNILKKAYFLHKNKIVNNKTAINFFINLLKSRRRVYETLLLMHETNLLSALLPEFKKIDSLSTNDVYHIYTVDAHSLNGIHILEKFVNFKIHKDLKDIAIDLNEEDMLVLNLSMLLHDIGKGYAPHHEKIGSKIAVKIAKRLGIEEKSHGMVYFLILNHFLMPLTSERRDMHDPVTIKTIADVCKDIKHLKFLFIISLCDSIAVAPGRFNSWRKMLLVELYNKTYSYIENENSLNYFSLDLSYYIDEIYNNIISEINKNKPEYFDFMLNIIKDNVNNNFNKDLHFNFKSDFEINNINNTNSIKAKEYIKNYLNSFYYPIKYLQRNSSEKIVSHIKLLSEIDDKHIFNYAVIPNKEANYFEFIICGKERKNIFSDITGTLSYYDFNIMSADINTRKDGNFIDIFFINHIYKDIDSEIEWDKIENIIGQIFQGTLTVSISDMFHKKIESYKIYKKFTPHVSSACNVYNNLSEEFTVIEIQAPDRKGLLYDISKVFNNFNIDIFESKITTMGSKALDTFYIKDEKGRKIKNILAIKKIKSAFMNIL